jgi:nitroreductase
MTVQEAILSRRSIRKYSDRPIEPEKLKLVLEAARLAPSATNGQNWLFIVVQDKEKLAELVEAADGQKFVGEAPAAIIACATSRRVMACGQPTDTIDCSIAMSFILLQAQELGLGTCWLGRFNADRVKKICDIPEEVSVIAMTPLGYPAESPAARPRKAAEEVIRFDSF